MDNEIELKLLAPSNAQQLIESQLLPLLPASAKVTSSVAQLFNQYFDTPERLLRQHDIGMRVRAKNHHYEQTVKTAGTVIGGLHQRPEYNISLPDCQPDLLMFDPQIWPHGLSASAVQREMTCLFTTHFTRNTYLLTLDDDSEIELVLDQGEIVSNDQREIICELELELKRGSAEILFDLAKQIAQLMPVTIGNLSKAARGYLLAEGHEFTARPMPNFLPLDDGDNLESGFCNSIEFALNYWQQHEQCYLRQHKSKDLYALKTAIELVVQTLTLYSKELDCPALDDLLEQVSSLLEDWHWLDDYLSIKELRSKKGPFQKRLSKHPDFLSYLHGRCDGMLEQHAPEALIRASKNVILQLELSRLMIDKPWRSTASVYLAPLRSYARKWLSQGWQELLQHMPADVHFQANNYLDIGVLLRQTLHIGFLTAALFTEKPDQFRASWLDILDGIGELKILCLLQVEVSELDVEDKDQLLLWREKKESNLLKVMEQSRASALKMEPYW